MNYKQAYNIMTAIQDCERWASLLDGVFGKKTVSIMEQMHTAHLGEIMRIRQNYYKHELPEVMKLIDEYISQHPEEVEEAEKRRREESEELKKKVEKVIRIKTYRNEDTREWQVIQNKLNMETATIQDIEQARKYPIEKIIKVNNQGFALCTNHKESSPSMFCKNGYAYCFSCGYTADPIKLYQDIHRTNFNETIKDLTS